MAYFHGELISAGEFWIFLFKASVRLLLAMEGIYVRSRASQISVLKSSSLAKESKTEKEAPSMRNRETTLKELRVAVTEERQCALRVLHLLREVEMDQHFLSMGYPTLFEFATRELGYSAGAAHRRIQSMRLLKTLPELEQKIEDGSLSLCVAAKTQSFFRKEDQKRREEGQKKLSSDSQFPGKKYRNESSGTEVRSYNARFQKFCS